MYKIYSNKFWLLIFLICPAFVVGQECDIFLSYSDFGEGGARTNTELTNPVVGPTYSVYVWIDENFEIDTGIFLNIRPCEPGGIQFSGAEVFNPDITLAGGQFSQRWIRKQEIPTILADCVENLDAVGAPGISLQNTGPVFLDALYDPSEQAFLYARIDFEVIDSAISTEFCCEVGCGLIVHQCQPLKPNCCGATVVGNDEDECKFESDNILCELDEMGQPTGTNIVTGTFTNLQDIPGTHLLLLPQAVSPAGVELCFGSGFQVLQLETPLNNGESVEVGADLSNSDAIIIKNAMPGDEVCFDLILLGENGVECCHIEVCFEMPPCDCLQVDRRLDEITDVVCNDDGTVDFSYTFQLTNLFGQDVYHTFLAPNGDEMFSPDYFDLFAANGNAPLGQGQSVSLKTVITGAQSQEPVSFLITVHNEDLSECCSRNHDVLAPECDMTKSNAGGGTVLGDVNGDGFVDLTDVQPFVDLLSSGGFNASADINLDGTVNLTDVAPFVSLLSGN